MDPVQTPTEEAADPTDRFVRQATLVPREKLLATPCTIIGVGAVGRQLALQLAAIGVPKLQIIDNDEVDYTNITTQGYSHRQLGLPKVCALDDTIRNHFDDVDVETIHDLYRPPMHTHPAVFCCVDKISVRAAIWRTMQHRAKFFCDTRMLSELLTVLTATENSPKSQRAYAESLFEEADTEPGRCTARSTIYTTAIAAGLAVHQFTRWLRDLPTDNQLFLSLPSSEMNLIEAELKPESEAEVEAEAELAAGVET